MRRLLKFLYGSIFVLAAVLGIHKYDTQPDLVWYEYIIWVFCYWLGVVGLSHMHVATKKNKVKVK